MKPRISSLIAAVDRAIAEIRQGGAVLIKDGQTPLLAVLSAELASPARLDFMAALSMQPLRLVITASRAIALGLTASRTQIITLPLPLDPDLIRSLVDPVAPAPVAATLAQLQLTASPLDHSCDAAIALMKLAQLLPAAIIASPPPRTSLMRLTARKILNYHKESATTLTMVGEARVPLHAAENTRIVAFRPKDGGAEHLAMIIGEPDLTQPVLIRLHSECFTGDLLGSMRCDCGEQLRGAIAEIAAAGAGILVYLAQEGRGIGLINKLRSYNLQDQGFDTLDANAQLGFDHDERRYDIASQMLTLLGVAQVRVMTNNPLKTQALSQCGIHVVERVPHIFPSNDHNVEYLSTKATKGGHLF